MKKYIIDINSNAEDRWKPIISDYKVEISNVFNKLNQMNNGLLSSLASGLINIANKFGYVLYEDELNYISKECAIPFGQLVMLQIMYELSACCTSAVFPIDGIPVHFRTMDWPLSELKEMTIIIDFQDKGKTKYSTVTWAGYIGILTAIKPNVCSISLNYRSTGEGLVNNLLNLGKSYWPAGYLIRSVMDNDLNYSQIIDRLSNCKLVAPCYLIVCGIETEQCINIVRDRESASIHQIDNDKIVQTNIDPFVDCRSKNILYSTERKQLAEQIINDIQSNAGQVNDLFEKFRQFPIINEETVYMCMMMPKTGYFEVNIV